MVNLFNINKFGNYVTEFAVSDMKGSRDGLCPLEKLEGVRRKMNCASAMHVIEGGDHSFKVSKKHLQITGCNQEETEQQAAEAIAAFVSQHLKEK